MSHSIASPPSPAQQALERRSPMELAGAVIKTPQQLADRIREVQSQAHILSPSVAISAIPDHYVINTAVVVIDPTSKDVYTGSFHKKSKVGNEWVANEVSLSKTGLLKILGAAGVNVTRSARTDSGEVSNYWTWCTEGTITDFDGAIRSLPPGNVEIDLRDGSAQIGEWTPAVWAEHERAAEQERIRRKLSADDAWKVKAEPIDGWTRERVMQARSKGLRLAEAKSLTALIRNLGIKQSYTIAELQKPFVIFRATFMPDMTDSAVRQMVTAAHLGAVGALYPSAVGPRQVTGDVIDIHASSPDDVTDEADETAQAAVPEGAQELDDIPAATPAAPTFHITKASQLAGDYFFETQEGVTFTTDDLDTARALNAARKAGTPLLIEGEPMQVKGATYHRVLNAQPATPTSIAGTGLPDPKKL